MSNRDRNNRKSGISDSNRHNKYHSNKWKNNWGRNFNNYGNSNYRNTDYGSGPSDNRYGNNWNQTLPNPWDTDWFNNQQHPNFTNNHYTANNFNIAPGLGVNFSRTNRSKNLKEKPDRSSDRNFTPKTQDSNATYQSVDKNPKKTVKSNKDTPSTVTSSSSPSTTQPCSSNSQPCSSNSIENVAIDASKPHEQHSAEQVTKKLIHQLTSMNKHNLKQMINNPSSKYETALQTHARNRMRAEMRTKLQNMSSNQENQLVNNVLDTEESVDMDKIPDNVFDEIGRVLDINLLGQEDNSNKKYNDSDDKDKEQIAYPEDLFLRAEKLLMENSILFLEDRLNDSMLNGDRLEEDRTPIKIKNEIKEEPDDISDDNFFEIQESAGDTFLLNDLVFEDRGGSTPLRNDHFDEQLNEMGDKDETTTVSHRGEDENSGELVRTVKEEISEIDFYEQTTNNNVKDILPDPSTKNSMQPSSKLYKSPDKQRSTQCSPSANSHKTITSDDFKALLANVKQEFNRETESNSSTTIHKVNPFAVSATSQQPPKKNDLFTKLQNSGAFEPTSVKRRVDSKLESTDNKRDSLYSRKKKKKHKSRSRSLRSRSRSSSRSRNSRRSKKSSRDRSRRRDDTSQYSMPSDTMDSRDKVANIELCNDSSAHTFDQNDESSSKLVEYDEPMVESNQDKTDPSIQAIQVACIDVLTTKTVEAQPDMEPTDCDEVIAAEESILDNHSKSPNNFLDAQSMIPSDDLINLNKGIDLNSSDQPNLVQSNSISNRETENVTTTAQRTIAESVEEIVPEATEKVTKMVEDTVAETVEEIVDEAAEKFNGATAEPLTKTNTGTLDVTVKETVEETANYILNNTVCDKVEDTASEAVEDITGTNSAAVIFPKPVTDRVENGQTIEPTAEVSTEMIVEESTSIGSNSLENSIALNSESQSSVPDDAMESNQTQKNNIVAIRKIVLKPSSSRHQKSSSKHRCEKERHVASSHKVKKLDTSSQSSKKSDHKDNSSGASMIKHSHNDQPHRVWRSAGEKKCIEPSTKSTLRSIDIFDPTRPVELLKVIEPAKPPVESKCASSPRKERGKSQSHTAMKSPISVGQARNESKKSSQSTPVKKGNSIAIKEKLSPMHRNHVTVDSNNKSSSVTESTLVNQVTHSLSDSLKMPIDGSVILQRMKDIDLKMMEMMVKKSVIDEKIMNLHKEKSDIDQATMKLQHERFSLLTSLLATNSTTGQRKLCELPRNKSNIEPKVVELSSDDEVLMVGTPMKKSSSKTFRTNAPHNSKRKLDDDAKADGVDGTKCKKLKINLNSLKSLANSKGNARSHVDCDEMQSDLKTKMLNTTRRCTVRLTKLSAKKIKLLIGRAETETVDGGDADGRLKNDVDPLHKLTFDGNFRGHRLPIVHLQVIDGFLIAASEDSNLYMHDLVTGKLLGTFTEHAKTVTNFIVTETNHIYSVSLDGCLKKLSIKKFDEQLLSVNVGEALQVMDYSWDTVFIGSRSGKIYIFNTKTDTLADECLCSVGKSIMALKATKEGPRKILIASSRCHNISVRDAISGLLLRTIEVPDKLTIYSILLDGGQLYCGTNKNLVFRYEFTSGAEISRIKLGTGTICLKSYKNSLILGGCYDGYIYAYDTKNEIQLSRFPGPGKMLLHFDVFKDNIIAAAKDKSLCVLEVPHDIVSHE
ncbi:FK506-binding protein 5 [Bradysia coprophila]|uniref:FK506-binding protein 5 n=1 Tax=Bradysia coprophila TaxID=38358 RepID=UPI00187DB7E0|nr:FK506-binding protein 5 [Bradysia coprophila]